MKMMNTRVFRSILYSFFLIAILLLVGSCSEPVGGMGKSPVYLTTEPAEDVYGIAIDVYTPGDPGGTTPSDGWTFRVLIKSNWKSDALVNTRPYATVTIQEYRVNYYRIDGKTPVPDPFMVQLNSIVEAGGSLNLGTLILKPDALLRSPLKELALGGGEGEIMFNAVIDYYGEDQMGNKLTARFVLPVWAADY
jgi:hypothetical protein